MPCFESKKTECDSFSEKIATNKLIGFTTPLPEELFEIPMWVEQVFLHLL